MGQGIDTKHRLWTRAAYFTQADMINTQIGLHLHFLTSLLPSFSTGHFSTSHKLIPLQSTFDLTKLNEHGWLSLMRVINTREGSRAQYLARNALSHH